MLELLDKEVNAKVQALEVSERVKQLLLALDYIAQGREYFYNAAMLLYKGDEAKAMHDFELYDIDEFVIEERNDIVYNLQKAVQENNNVRLV